MQDRELEAWTAWILACGLGIPKQMSHTFNDRESNVQPRNIGLEDTLAYYDPAIFAAGVLPLSLSPLRCPEGLVSEASSKIF